MEKENLMRAKEQEAAQDFVAKPKDYPVVDAGEGNSLPYGPHMREMIQEARARDAKWFGLRGKMLKHDFGKNDYESITDKMDNSPIEYVGEPFLNKEELEDLIRIDPELAERYSILFKELHDNYKDYKFEKMLAVEDFVASGEIKPVDISTVKRDILQMQAIIQSARAKIESDDI